MSTAPSDLDAERAVLGALMSGAPLADVGLPSTAFYRPAHQLIYEVITALHGSGAPAEPVAVADELRRRGDLSRAGDAPYLHTCLAAVPAAVNAGHYASIIREYAERRLWIEHAARIHKVALDPGQRIDTVRSLAAAPPAEGKPKPPGRRLVLTRASEIEPEPVVWAWEDNGAGRIPAGSLGLAAGREGTGKSSFLIWMAARITTGTLPGSLDGPRAVIYVAVEDSWKFTIVPRLMAAGANRDLIYRAEVQAVEGETVSLSLPADNKLLEEAITDNDVAMVALDPLMSAISDTLDTHVNRQVRQALDPLARIADRTGAVFAGIAHFNKSSGTDASSLITASGAFKDVARFIFAFATDEEDGASVITQTKNSLGHSNLPSLAYRIIEAVVPTAKGDARVGRFILDGESERSVRDVLSVQGGGQEHDEKTRAEDYLKKALTDGPRRTKEVEEEAREAHSISKRTLERARTKLRIPAAQRESGPANADSKRKKEWWIALPEHASDLQEPYQPMGDTTTSTDRQTARPPDLGTVGGVGGLNYPDDRQTANTAKPAPPDGAGGLAVSVPAPLPGAGTDGSDRSLTGLTAGERSRDPEPPCQHAECWDALVGQCIASPVRDDGLRAWPEGSNGADAA